MFKIASVVPASQPWWMDPVDVGLTTADEGHRIYQGVQAGRAAGSAATGAKAAIGLTGKVTASKLPIIGAGLSYWLGKDQMKGIGDRIDSFKGTGKSYLTSAEGASDIMSGIETYAPAAGMAIGAGIGSFIGPVGTVGGAVAGGAIGGLVGSAGTAGKFLQKGFTGFDADKSKAAYSLASGQNFNNTADYTSSLLNNYKNTRNLKTTNWFGKTRDATSDQGEKIVAGIKPGGKDRIVQPTGQVS